MLSAFVMTRAALRPACGTALARQCRFRGYVGSQTTMPPPPPSSSPATALAPQLGGRFGQEQQQEQQQQLRSLVGVAHPSYPSRPTLSPNPMTPSLNLNLLSNLSLSNPNTANITPTPSPTAIQTRTFASKRFHRKKIIKMAKGYRGRANRTFRAAIKRVEKAMQHAYRDRRLRRRDFRRLWITRINAGVRQHGVRYSRWVQMQGRSGIRLDRKVLSELAMMEPFSFRAVVDVVKGRADAEGGAGAGAGGETK